MDQEKPQMKDLKENSQRLLERSKSALSASGENRQLLASVDLNFNGMPGGSGKLADAPMPMGTASPFTSDIRLFQASAKDLYSDATFRHHLPIGAGVNVSFALPHSLSLTSGVHYTLLWSQMQASGVSGYKNQYVHYIGVPLQLDWNFFERAGFTLRTGLGARMDICVKAVLDGQKMDEKPLQWTTVASVAASYNITPLITIYLQPELDWFITDTSLKTIRGRSPVNATFRAGLQFNLFAR